MDGPKANNVLPLWIAVRCGYFFFISFLLPLKKKLDSTHPLADHPNTGWTLPPFPNKAYVAWSTHVSQEIASQIGNNCKKKPKKSWLLKTQLKLHFFEKKPTGNQNPRLDFYRFYPS